MSISDRYLPLIIKKEFLFDKHYYAGICRNTKIAKWNEKDQVFYYRRYKLGRSFIEDIEYWQEGAYFDQFIPILDLGLILPLD